MQHVFGEIGLHPRGESAANVLVTAIGGESDHVSLGKLGTYGGGGFHSAHAGHAEIEQSHVGPVLPVEFYGLVAVGGFGNHDHVGLHVDDGAHAHARHQVIFSDQYANFSVHGNGT